jgi:PPM family protein phosphatase
MPEEGVGFPPASTRVRVTFGAYSRRSRLHTVNEDHYAIAEYGRHHNVLMTSLPEEEIQKRYAEHGYGMVVADGLGGDGRGEAASRLALETIMRLVLLFGRWHLRIDAPIAEEIMDRAERFVRHADSTLVHDSLERRRQLMRLTRDHTLGVDTAIRAATAPLVDVSHAARDLTHIITETLGMAGPVGPHIEIDRFTVVDNDVILLCTNGLTDSVDEATIADALAENRPADATSRHLVDLAADSADDVTALVARYHVPA